MLWFILIMVVVIIGASVLVGRALSRQGQGGRSLSRQERITALKASGAMPQRKESRR